MDDRMVTVPQSLIDSRDQEIHDLRVTLAKIRHTIELCKQKGQPLSGMDVYTIYEWIDVQSKKDYR